MLTNPAMPGLVKIGRSARQEANVRIAQLYTTGVPVPYRLEFACQVPNSADVERALHVAFAPQRVNPRREFFRIEPDQAIAILRLLHMEDATDAVEAQPVDVDEQSLAAAQQLRKRRPNLNFVEMGVPLGSELRAVDSDAVATVIAPKRVRLGDQEMSITTATQRVLQLDYAVSPGSHWTYNGRSINELYEETYGDME